MQMDTLFVHCTFKSTEKANRKRPTFRDTGYLVSVCENEALGSKFHQKSNIPNTSLRNQQRWQLSSTVSCQGSRTSASSGLFVLGLWTDRGQAGFMRCWVTPISPRWQEERQTHSHITVSQDSPPQLHSSHFPMERAAWSHTSPEVLNS